ncbi:hypothetical protein [Streptomyces melanogenes]|uniref:hypothetical protein n=1 Tax=Streptomyces melanogenes TaxID=67326 RepID=UPI00167E10C4|nr:hypothetical protein [Streptomyces melanogenes]GGP78498.1 hypothetical protein GCM10010278_66190 [Streptomyces melanogenes]
MNWDRDAALFDTPAALEDDDLEPGTMGPHFAVLEIGVSLAVGRPVDLRRAARELPAAEWRWALELMAPAANYV